MEMAFTVNGIGATTLSQTALAFLSHGLTRGQIIGLSLGLVFGFLLVLLVFLVFFCWRGVKFPIR